MDLILVPSDRRYILQMGVKPFKTVINVDRYIYIGGEEGEDFFLP